MSVIEIDKDVFIKAAQILSLVPVNTGIPSSENIRVSVFKDEMELSLAANIKGIVRLPMSASAPGSSTFYIERAILLPFLLAGKDWKENFQLSFGDPWKITQKNREAKLHIRVEDIGGYGTWEGKKLKGAKMEEPLRKLILAAYECTTNSPTTPQLHCVYLGKESVLATNTTMVFRGENPQIGEMLCPFPIDVIPLLADQNIQSIGVEGKRVVLTCELGFLEGQISQVARTGFPRQAVLESMKLAKTYPLVSELPAELLYKMLERLAGYLQGIMDRDLMLRIEVKKGTMTVFVKVKQGLFEETVHCRGLKECYLQWPLQMVKPIIQYMASVEKTIKIQTDEKKKAPYLVSAGKVKLLIARRTE